MRAIILSIVLLAVAFAKLDTDLDPIYGFYVKDGGFSEQNLAYHLSTVEKPFVASGNSEGAEFDNLSYLLSLLHIPGGRTGTDATADTYLDFAGDMDQMDFNPLAERPLVLLYVPGLEIEGNELGRDMYKILYPAGSSSVHHSSFTVISNLIYGKLDEETGEEHRCITNKSRCSMQTILDVFCKKEFQKHGSVGLCPVVSVSGNRNLAWVGSKSSYAYWSTEKNDIGCETNHLLRDGCRSWEIQGGAVEFVVNGLYDIEISAKAGLVTVKRKDSGKERVYPLDEPNSEFFGEQYLIHSILNALKEEVGDRSSYFALFALTGLKEIYGEESPFEEYQSIMLESVKEISRVSGSSNFELVSSSLTSLGKKSMRDVLGDYQEKLYSADRGIFSALYPFVIVGDPVGINQVMTSNWTWMNVTESDITAFHITTFTSLFLMIIFIVAVLTILTMHIEKDPMIYRSISNKKKKN